MRRFRSASASEHRPHHAGIACRRNQGPIMNGSRVTGIRRDRVISGTTAIGPGRRMKARTGSILTTSVEGIFLADGKDDGVTSTITMAGIARANATNTVGWGAIGATIVAADHLRTSSGGN